MAKAVLDAAQAGSSFDDPTATLLLQVRVAAWLTPAPPLF
jgi:hypothetical protein